MEHEKSRVRGREIGATGATLASNLKRLRGDMPLRDLEKALTALDVKISASGLQKIESGARRVDADEIIALSIALNVNPNALLLPNFSGEVDVSNEISTNLEGLTGETVWHWADGYKALPVQKTIKALQGEISLDEREVSKAKARRDEAFQAKVRPESEVREVREFLVSVARKLVTLEPGERLTLWSHSPEDESPAFNILEYPPFTFTGSAAVEMERHTKQLLAGILREPSNAHYLESVLKELRNNGDD
ncbi:MAG: helix-turn-helix domain-containing protein [Glutamicibacter arilaitensis]|uniref:helix-turn-helix domain-containing protein n=1 Tax=Glutamicibacter arilaitensis TaxID=256701 RepID=UPI003FB8E2C7